MTIVKDTLYIRRMVEEVLVQPGSRCPSGKGHDMDSTGAADAVSYQLSADRPLEAHALTRSTSAAVVRDSVNSLTSDEHLLVPHQ